MWLRFNSWGVGLKSIIEKVVSVWLNEDGDIWVDENGDSWVSEA